MSLLESAIKYLLLFILIFGSGLQLNADEPYPLEYFALRDVVSNVSVSPDGKKLALLKISTRDANPVLQIFDTDDLQKSPYLVAADPMEITFYQWVSDTNILLVLRQKVRDKIDGYNRGVFENELALLDIEKQEMKSLGQQNAGFANSLPLDPEHVLISVQPGGSKSVGGSKAFTSPQYYKLNLKTGRKQLVLKGRPDIGGVEFDANGIPFTGNGFDEKTKEYVWYTRRLNSKKWEEVFRISENSHETGFIELQGGFSIEGRDQVSSNILYVRAFNGRNTIGLWEFDIDKHEFGNLVYARNDVNVLGVRTHSNRWSNPGIIVGARYGTNKTKYKYFDEVEEATYEQLEELIPAAHGLGITSRSRDGKTLVVSNSGPRDPGTFYLLNNGKLETIGSQQPLLSSDRLADVKYISWESRDNKEIHGYVTVPNGKGPFPLVVMPHGGPFVPEIIGYDEWGQMLANNGYMVLQPQYRGSTNYGLDFYKSSFMDGGEAGYKMQDDKDDGALYLVKEGLVDPDRIAMFGWSYGGYAALIAASRKDQIYQCSIAGAAVADMVMQVNYYYARLRGAQLEQQVKYRKGSVNPIDVVEDVNIPLFVIHGSVDQRVPVDHAKKYLKLLEKYEKNHKYLELDGADHFSNTLSFDHQNDLYNGIIDYLKNDCGPGGL